MTCFNEVLWNRSSDHKNCPNTPHTVDTEYLDVNTHTHTHTHTQACLQAYAHECTVHASLYARAHAHEHIMHTHAPTPNKSHKVGMIKAIQLVFPTAWPNAHRKEAVSREDGEQPVFKPQGLTHSHDVSRFGALICLDSRSLTLATTWMCVGTVTPLLSICPFLSAKTFDACVSFTSCSRLIYCSRRAASRGVPSQADVYYYFKCIYNKW